MLKKTIKFTDYNGVQRSEDFYFNLSKAELLEMEMGTTGGFTETIRKMISAQDVPALARLFKELILKSYGVKSDDGKRFIKNDALREEFMQTEAFSDLYLELATDADAGAQFVNGIMPADIAAEAAKEAKKLAAAEALTGGNA